MAGSDTPEFLFLYGFSMHRELKALADAGLPNYAVLAAATRNAHEYLGTIKAAGTIEKNKRADLILLDADPLKDITNTDKRAGVMLKGKWYTQAEMNKWLDEIAPRIAGSIEQNEKTAAAAIEKLGGKVERNAEHDVIKVDLNNAKVTDADLKWLRAFPALQWLDLRITNIGDEGVSNLKLLHNIKFLNLFRTNLTDKGLVELNGLGQLETLLIGGTKITDEGLANVAGLKRLKKVSLFRTAVTDAGVKHIEKLASLEVLLIGESKITDEGSKALLKSIPNLRFSEQT